MADMVKYAADAKKILEECLEREINDAADSLYKGVPTASVAGHLEKEVRSSMRHKLFSKVKHERIVTLGNRWQYYPSLGIYRSRPAELTMSDVPRKYLDIDALIPDFKAMLAEAMLTAGKKAMAMKVVETTKQASE